VKDKSRRQSRYGQIIANSQRNEVNRLAKRLIAYSPERAAKLRKRCSPFVTVTEIPVYLPVGNRHRLFPDNGEVGPSTEISDNATHGLHKSDYVFCNPYNSLPVLRLRSENQLRAPLSVPGSENRRNEIFSSGCTQLILPGRVHS
jgi:hypothetical protein